MRGKLKMLYNNMLSISGNTVFNLSKAKDITEILSFES